MADTRRTGLVQINTGNGKGKTTAALGTILRAADTAENLRHFLHERPLRAW